MRKCKYCKKLTENPKFCSRKCNCITNSKIGGCAAQKTLKKYKLGVYNSDIQKKIHIKLKKLKNSAFYNSEMRHKNTMKAIKNMKKNKIGFFNFKLQKKIHIKLEKLKNSAFYNSEMQSISGKKGGQKAAENIRNNSPYIFKNIYFSSNLEREIGISIYYQFEKLKEGVNFQIKIGTLTYDFLILKFKCFIEFHPWDRILSYENYYKLRRQNLNKNGYKNYSLTVIK